MTNTQRDAQHREAQEVLARKSQVRQRVLRELEQLELLLGAAERVTDPAPIKRNVAQSKERKWWRIW